MPRLARAALLLALSGPLNTEAVRVRGSRAAAAADAGAGQELAACRPRHASVLCPRNAEQAAGFDPTDKACIAQLCDIEKNEQCCKVRSDLIERRLCKAEDFALAGVVPKAPVKPEVFRPQPILIDTFKENELESGESKCPQVTKKQVDYGDGLVVNFDLPASSAGVEVKRKCGVGAADPEAQVVFTCGAALSWTGPVGMCVKAKHCPAQPFVVHKEDRGPSGTRKRDFTFNLPPTANYFLKKVGVSVPCPKFGTGRFICNASLQWELKDETCSNEEGGLTQGVAPGQCPQMKFEVSIGDSKHTYSLSSSVSAGMVQSRRCSIGKLIHGSIDFKCVMGDWTIDKHSCQENAGVVCPSGNVQMDGEDQPLVLPESSLGIIPVPCSSGYVGKVEFECAADGSWSHHDGECTKA